MKLFVQSISVLLTGLLATGPISAQSAAAQALQLRIIESDGTAMGAASQTAKGFTVQVTDNSGAGVPDAAVVFHLPDSGPTGSFSDGSHAAVSYTDETGTAHISGIRWGQIPGAVAIRVTATKGAAHAGMLLEQNLTSSAVPAAASESAQKTEPAATAPAALPKSEPATTTDSAAVQPAAAPKPRTAIEPGIPAARSERIATAAAPSATLGPSVSIVNGPTGEKIRSSSSKTKWIILAAIAAGAGAGVAMMGKGKSSSSASSSSTSPTIGTPSISIGQP
ncbi:MAG: hypothetical protein JOZ62_11560 [Acidobacteriaceae bacterium]|nr:hypothetical protein [Acidobacteriaceae bacterium]